MAKKSSTAAEPEQSPHAGKNVVKFFVNEEAHAKIQLASAMSGRSMGAFCRDLVMEIAEEMTANVPRLGKKESILSTISPGIRWRPVSRIKVAARPTRRQASMPSLNPSDAIVTCLSLEQLHVKAWDEQNAAPIAADAAKFFDEPGEPLFDLNRGSESPR